MSGKAESCFEGMVIATAILVFLSFIVAASIGLLSCSRLAGEEKFCTIQEGSDFDVGAELAKLNQKYEDYRNGLIPVTELTKP